MGTVDWENSRASPQNLSWKTTLRVGLDLIRIYIIERGLDLEN